MADFQIKDITLHQIEVDESLHEVRRHGEFEYPVSTYFIRLSALYMNMVRWHWHEEMEVLIVNNGTAHFRTEEDEVILHPGQGILVTPNLLHTIHSGEEEECSLYSLMFQPQYLFGYGNPGMTSRYLTPLLSSPDFKYLVLEENASRTGGMLSLVNDIIACNLTKHFGYELRTKGYLCDFWCQLISLDAPHREPAPAPVSVTTDAIRIKQAIRYIEQRYMEPLTLDEISAAIHVSKSECCRCFKRTLGLSPFDYLLKYRIFESTRKLHQDESLSHSISDLAASVGFNNTSYFNKLFKKYLSCTPSDYKRQIQNIPYARDFNPSDMHLAQPL